jgi:hypothetical protein
MSLLFGVDLSKREQRTTHFRWHLQHPYIHLATHHTDCMLRNYSRNSRFDALILERRRYDQDRLGGLAGIAESV